MWKVVLILLLYFLQQAGTAIAAAVMASGQPETARAVARQVPVRVYPLPDPFVFSPRP